MARVAKAEKAVNVEEQSVAIKFANGSELATKLAELPQAIVVRLALHGLSQKIGDSYAGAETVEEAAKWAAEVRDSLVKGEWSTRVTGSSKGPRVTLLAEAIARLTGADISDVIAKLDEMDEETIKAVRANDKIKLAINEIKTERLKASAAKGGDSTDLSALFS